jgi:hypothetical protein
MNARTAAPKSVTPFGNPAPGIEGAAIDQTGEHRALGSSEQTQTVAQRAHRDSIFRRTEIQASIALSGGRLSFGLIEVALPEVERDFIKRTLFPLLRLRQPKNPAL